MASIDSKPSEYADIPSKLLLQTYHDKATHEKCISGLKWLREEARPCNEKLEGHKEIIKALIVKNKKLIDERMKDELE